MNCHGRYIRKYTGLFIFGNKEIVTGQPDANVRVHIPRVIVRIHRPGTSVHAIVPIAANHRLPFAFVDKAA
jgi:hypothetical protein